MQDFAISRSRTTVRTPASPSPAVSPTQFRHRPVTQASQPARLTPAGQLSLALGFFSIGLGLAELLMPHTVAKASGADDRPLLLRLLGLREVASGAGILMQRHRASWLWSRVAGDAMDIALLAMVNTSNTNRRRKLAFATAAIAGITVLDTLAAVDHTRTRRSAAALQAPGTIHVKKTLVINRSLEDCYRFWRDFENFPRFMQHVESVQQLDGTRSHWSVHAPLGRLVEWTAELTSDVPDKQLSWRTLSGSEIEHIGSVRFAPASGRHGTQIEVELQYLSPLGKAGALLAKLFGEEPGQQIDEDLRRLKQLLETGEIATTAGQSAGKRGAFTRLLRKGEPG